MSVFFVLIHEHIKLFVILNGYILKILIVLGISKKLLKLPRPDHRRRNAGMIDRSISITAQGIIDFLFSSVNSIV